MEYMEAGEHRYNELMDEFSPPHDWDNPEWNKKSRVHNWRNYVSEQIQLAWGGFTGEQKVMLSANFEEMAGNEEWD